MAALSVGHEAVWLLQFANKPSEMCLERRREIIVEGIIPAFISKQYLFWHPYILHFSHMTQTLQSPVHDAAVAG